MISSCTAAWVREIGSMYSIAVSNHVQIIISNPLFSLVTIPVERIRMSGEKDKNISMSRGGEKYIGYCIAGRENWKKMKRTERTREREQGQNSKTT